MRTVPSVRPAGRLGCLTAAALAVVLAAASSEVAAQVTSPTTVRWDIVSLDFSTFTLRPGGVASSLANDGSKITITGSGTFQAGPQRRVMPADGAGTWETSDASGNVTGSGTFRTTDVARWTRARGSLDGVTDLIGSTTDASAGLVILRVVYSDGSRGTLTVSCHLDGTPDSVFEGITASKGFVSYWNRVPPAPGVDANRTLFHFVVGDEQEPLP